MASQRPKGLIDLRRSTILWITRSFYPIANLDQNLTINPAKAMTLRRAFRGLTNKESLRKERVIRQIKKLFDHGWFVATYGEANIGGSDPLEYYLLNISNPRLSPSPFFDSEWYVRAYEGTDMKGLSPIEHYILHGDAANMNPSPLFDTAFFRETNPSIPANDTALAHFVSEKTTSFPNPLFDSQWYATRYNVSDPIPFRHFITIGWLRGLDPSPLFSTAYYRAAYIDTISPEVNPLADYLGGGDRRGRNPSPYFNSSWYLTTYPDVAASQNNALAHYVRYGYKEGRRPSPY